MVIPEHAYHYKYTTPIHIRNRFTNEEKVIISGATWTAVECGKKSVECAYIMEDNSVHYPGVNGRFWNEWSIIDTIMLPGEYDGD